MRRLRWVVALVLIGLTACTSSDAEDVTARGEASSGPPAADAVETVESEWRVPFPPTLEDDPWGVSEVPLPRSMEEAEDVLAAMPDSLAGEGPGRRGRAVSDAEHAFIEYSADVGVSVFFDRQLEDLTKGAKPRTGGPYLQRVTGYDYDSPDLAWHTGYLYEGVWLAMFLDPATGTMVSAHAKEPYLDRLVTEFVTAASGT